MALADNSEVNILSRDEIAKIRCEEKIRSECRQEFEPAPPTKGERFLKALNSNFAIWFLSTAVVSAISFAYTKNQESFKLEEAKALEVQRTKELSDRLNLEISFRYSAVLFRLREADKLYGTKLTDASRTAVERALAPIALPISDAFPPLFPEFKSFSGLALVAELRRHSTTEAEKELLKQTIADTSGLIYEALGESKQVSRTPRAVATQLLKRMGNTKWNNGFPFTDCKEENPFC